MTPPSSPPLRSPMNPYDVELRLEGNGRYTVAVVAENRVLTLTLTPFQLHKWGRLFLESVLRDFPPDPGVIPPDQ